MATKGTMGCRATMCWRSTQDGRTGTCVSGKKAPEPQGMFHRLFGRKTWAAIEDHTAPPEILGDKPFSEFRLTVRGCVNVQSLDLGVLPPLGAPNPRYEAGG